MSVVMLCFIIVGMLFLSSFSPYEEWDGTKTVLHDYMDVYVMVWVCFFMLNAFSLFVSLITHARAFKYIYLVLMMVSAVKLGSLILLCLSPDTIFPMSF